MPRELSSFSWQGFLNNEWQLPWIVTQQKCDLLLRIAEPPPDKSPPYTRRLNLTGNGVTVSLNRYGLVIYLQVAEIYLPLKTQMAKKPFFGIWENRQYISLQWRTVLHWQGEEDWVASFVFPSSLNGRNSLHQVWVCFPLDVWVLQHLWVRVAICYHPAI